VSADGEWLAELMHQQTRRDSWLSKNDLDQAWNRYLDFVLDEEEKRDDF
jgi:hypothetical protein